GNFDRIRGPYVMTRSSVEVYDPQHDKWDFKAIMWELDVPPYQIVDVNRKLYSSGDSFKLWKGYIEAYDEKQNIWNGVNESNLHCKMPWEASGLRLQVYVFDTTANGDERRTFEPVEEERERKLCGRC
ncbi:kelch 8, partial [Olea europaea subsp. europaea]